jgi:hypothetical protein
VGTRVVDAGAEGDQVVMGEVLQIDSFGFHNRGVERVSDGIG